MEQPDLLGIFVVPLESAGIDYMVTGSVAAIIYGHPRMTNDIDMVVHLGRTDADRLPAIFPASEYYCPPPEVIRIEMARPQRGHFNLIHHDTGFKADCYLLAHDPLHHWGMERRKRIGVRPLPEFWVAPPEYVILRKLEFYREGRSSKHLDDIRAMLQESAEAIDHAVLQQKITELGLGSEWNMVGGVDHF
jgi:hypothetical protein